MKLSSLVPARFRKGQAVIPVVRLSGVIAASGAPFSPVLSLAACAQQLQRAFEIKEAPVVAIVVNSPGGSPVQSRLIHGRIRQLAKKHDKKVLVFAEDVAASGGYMIALAGDEIIADETSIVGSIGVVSAGFGFPEAIARLGIERRVYTAGENKAILDPFKPEKESDIEFLKSIQLDMHRIFIAMVKEARGAKLADDKDIFSGLFWIGTKAKELGLVDSCGMLGPVIAERYGDKAELRLITAKRSFFGRGQQGVGISGGHEIGSALAQGLPAALIAELEHRAMWQRFGL
jgi:serine protease SohB